MSEAVQILLEHGASLSAEAPAEGKGYRPLIAAVNSANDGCVRLLLDAQADPRMAWRPAPKHKLTAPSFDAFQLIRLRTRGPHPKREAYTQIEEMLLPRLDTLFDEALRLRVATEAEVDGATDRLARGAATEPQLVAEWEARVENATASA